MEITFAHSTTRLKDRLFLLPPQARDGMLGGDGLGDILGLLNGLQGGLFNTLDHTIPQVLNQTAGGVVILITTENFFLREVTEDLLSLWNHLPTLS